MTMQIQALPMPDQEIRVRIPIKVFESAMKRQDIAPIRKWLEFMDEQGKVPAEVAKLLKSKVDPQDVRDVFDEHTRLFWNGKGRQPQLLNGKRRIIKTRLERWSKDDLIAAMKAVACDEWRMGANPSRKTYTSIESIFRSDELVERYLYESEEITVEHKTRNVRENRDESALKLTELAAKLRSGVGVDLDDKQAYGRLVVEHREKYGERFEWETGTFQKI